MESSENTATTQTAEPGWYDFAGGKRFYDGQNWTEHYAYVPVAAATKSLSFVDVVMGTAVGGCIAFAIILGVAHLAPDEVFFPIKVLVDDPGF